MKNIITNLRVNAAKLQSLLLKLVVVGVAIALVVLELTTKYSWS